MENLGWSCSGIIVETGKVYCVWTKESASPKQNDIGTQPEIHELKKHKRKKGNNYNKTKQHKNEIEILQMLPANMRIPVTL